MNREIKFKVWDTDTKKWVENLTLCIDNISKVKKDWHIFCQYTGLKDKNGKEIYEGDIIESFFSDGKSCRHLVKWNDYNSGFDAFFIESQLPEDSCGINQRWITEYEKKIIGNIYENPKLLTPNP